MVAGIVSYIDIDENAVAKNIVEGVGVVIPFFVKDSHLRAFGALFDSKL